MHVAYRPSVPRFGRMVGRQSLVRCLCACKKARRSVHAVEITHGSKSICAAIYRRVRYQKRQTLYSMPSKRSWYSSICTRVNDIYIWKLSRKVVETHTPRGKIQEPRGDLFFFGETRKGKWGGGGGSKQPPTVIGRETYFALCPWAQQQHSAYTAELRPSRLSHRHPDKKKTPTKKNDPV